MLQKPLTTSISILAVASTLFLLSGCSDNKDSTPNTTSGNATNNANTTNQSNNPSSNKTHQLSHQQLQQQAIEQNIKNKENSLQQSREVIQKIYPRVTIPNQPGNVKALLSQLAQNAGYQLDWRLKGYYNLDEKNLTSYLGQPIGIVLMPMANLMTFANRNLRLHWQLSNPGEAFPYPLDVAYIACGKTILIFEMENKTSLPQVLSQKDYAGCSIPDATLGISLPKGSDPTNLTQLDFTQPPPFISSDNSGTIQMNLPQGVNINVPEFTTPTSNKPVDIEPSIYNNAKKAVQNLK